MTFELLTGELLFNPKKDNTGSYGKNDDHLAQIMELMGRFPKKMSLRGIKARKYLAKEGSLNRIPKLQNWSLKDVMIAKYRFTEDQAEFYQDFMMPMLTCYPERRVLARKILEHAWLRTPCPENYLMYTVSDSGTMKLIKRSECKSTISLRRETNSSNTSLRGKMETQKTIRNSKKKKISFKWKRKEISD
jgi:serine/threonine protein kinase